MNERKTEDLVESRLRRHGYYDPNCNSVVEKQQSESPRIKRLLKSASKSGRGDGRPEFIIQSEHISDFVIVIECKADSAKHESTSRTKPRDFAVDGVLLYASYLSREYDVLAIAVSGQDEASIRISHHLHLKGENTSTDWGIATDMVSFDDYHQAFMTSELKFRQDYQDLLRYSRSLNSKLQSEKITESHRGLLISGILIALKNKAFRQSYTSHQTVRHLSDYLLSTIGVEFENADIPTEKRDVLNQSFSFVKTLPVEKKFLEDLIQGIDDNINSFLRTHQYYDTIGEFYVEFLRYANNDKGLGIVLTPHHVADLFVRLAEVNKDSIVLDSCCGTAGLLIAAMKHMVRDAGADSESQKKIKSQQLLGIEYQPQVYTLAVCNMVLHDDGKANIIQGNCFENIGDKFWANGQNSSIAKGKPTVGLFNPPYKDKTMRQDKEELEYVFNNLEYLNRNGSSKCVAIVPITCATNPDGVIGELKRRILEKHTLEGVMSMPIELFHNSKTNVVTCIMVFTAHRPHSPNKKTWFGYWRDDGFVKTKHLGRIDGPGAWETIRQEWVNAFINRDVIDGFSVMQKVGPQDEWCVEAYLETDYRTIEPNLLSERAISHFVNHVMPKGQ